MLNPDITPNDHPTCLPHPRRRFRDARRAAVFLLGALSFATAAHSVVAADITWGPATNISSESDVSTAGTLIGAYFLGYNTGQTTTVNGVQFTSQSANGSAGVSFGPSNSFTLAPLPGGYISTVSDLNSDGSLSSSYQFLLDASANSVAPFTLTFNDLTAGDNYEFQFWDGSGRFSSEASDANGDSVTLVSPGNIAGQFAIGTFTADETGTETVSFTSSEPTLTAFQLRDLGAETPVPEPATALFGMALTGVCLAGRRRRPRA